MKPDYKKSLFARDAMIKPVLVYSDDDGNAILKKLKREDNRGFIVTWTKCPFCGEKAVQVNTFLIGTQAIARGRCLEGCRRRFGFEPEILDFG